MPAPAILPLQALVAAPAGWSAQPALARSICQAVESGAWDAHLRPAAAGSGPGLVESLLSAPAPQGRPFVRRLAVALLQRGAPAPTPDLVRQHTRTDPVLAAFVSAHARDPALLADVAAVEKVWKACRQSGAVFQDLATLIHEQGWTWETPLLGTRLLDLVLASAPGWMEARALPGDTPSAALEKRQRAWTNLAKSEQGHSTPLSRALLLAAAPHALEKHFGSLSRYGDRPVEAKLLRTAVAAAPVDELATLLDSMARDNGPWVNAWSAPALARMAADPFEIHALARQIRPSSPPTARKNGKSLPPPLPSAADLEAPLPPGATAAQAWGWMAHALAHTHPHPGAEPAEFKAVGIAGEPPAHYAANLFPAVASSSWLPPLPLPPDQAYAWWEKLCIRLATTPTPTPAVAQAAAILHALATAAEGGNPGRAAERLRQFLDSYTPGNAGIDSGWRVLAMELSLGEGAPSPTRGPRL